MKRLLFATAFAITPTLALAQNTTQSFPNYDAAVYCDSPTNQRIARLGGGGLCYNMHYMNRKAARETWPEASQAVRAECSKSADQYSDYGLLLVCMTSHSKDGRG